MLPSNKKISIILACENNFHVSLDLKKINGEVFNLNNEGEFNGLFKGGYFGPELRYLATDKFAVGLGYTYSLNFGTTKEGQTLNINSGAFVLKLYSSFDY